MGDFCWNTTWVLAACIVLGGVWGCRARTVQKPPPATQPMRGALDGGTHGVSKTGTSAQGGATTRLGTTGHRVQTRYHYIPVGATWKPDPRMQEWLTPYRKKLQAQMSRVLVRLEKGFTRQRPESSLGNLVADICLEKLRQMGLGVEVFITNHGGIRSDLAAGPVTLSVVYQILPFENELVVVRVSGKELQQIFTKIVQLGGEPIAGAKIRYHAKKKQLLSVTIGDEPLDLQKSYWLGTSDYLVATGFLQNYLREKSFYVTGITLRDTFRWGLETKAVSLQPQLDHRMGVVDFLGQPTPNKR